MSQTTTEHLLDSDCESEHLRLKKSNEIVSMIADIEDPVKPNSTLAVELPPVLNFSQKSSPGDLDPLNYFLL